MDDVTADGFTLGTISDFEAQEMDYGDAFVVAPDGSRTGLVWEVDDEVRLTVIRPPDDGRWGVYGVAVSGPMRTTQDAQRNLAHIVGLPRGRWWAARPEPS